MKAQIAHCHVFDHPPGSMPRRSAFPGEPVIVNRLSRSVFQRAGGFSVSGLSIIAASLRAARVRARRCSAHFPCFPSPVPTVDSPSPPSPCSYLSSISLASPRIPHANSRQPRIAQCSQLNRRPRRPTPYMSWPECTPSRERRHARTHTQQTWSGSICRGWSLG